MNCLFCSISAGEIPASIAYADEHVIAFHDISPQAPMHVVVVPRLHFDNVEELTRTDPALAAEVLAVAATLGQEQSGGFRLVVNTGADGGQSVNHVHVHVLAGRSLTWPPG